MKKKITIACVAAGKHAIKNTIPAIKRIKKFKLLAIYVRKKNVDHLKKFNVKIFFNYKELLCLKGLDSVYISAPPSLHYSLAKMALLAKKHVLIEKPSVVNLSQAKKLIKISDLNKLVLMEGLMYQYHEQFKTLKLIYKKIKSKNLIKVNSIFGFPHLPKEDFRYSLNQGGGALLDAGSYALSIIRNLSEEKLKIKKSVIKKRKFLIDVSGRVQFERIDNIDFSASWYFGGKYKNQITIKYDNEKIIVNRAFSKPENLQTTIDFFKKNKLIRKKTIKKDNHFINMFKIFFNSMQNDQDRLSLRDELYDQAILIDYIKQKSILNG